MRERVLEALQEIREKQNYFRSSPFRHNRFHGTGWKDVVPDKLGNLELLEYYTRTVKIVALHEVPGQPSLFE